MGFNKLLPTDYITLISNCGAKDASLFCNSTKLIFNTSLNCNSNILKILLVAYDNEYDNNILLLDEIESIEKKRKNMDLNPYIMNTSTINSNTNCIFPKYKLQLIENNKLQVWEEDENETDLRITWRKWMNKEQCRQKYLPNIDDLRYKAMSISSPTDQPTTFPAIASIRTTLVGTILSRGVGILKHCHLNINLSIEITYMLNSYQHTFMSSISNMNKNKLWKDVKYRNYCDINSERLVKNICKFGADSSHIIMIDWNDKYIKGFESTFIQINKYIMNNNDNELMNKINPILFECYKYNEKINSSEIWHDLLIDESVFVPCGIMNSSPRYFKCIAVRY